MIDTVIEEAKKALVTKYDPLEIYIFGSYAWGTPDAESDLDVLMIIEKFNKTPYETLVDAHRTLMNLEVPKDILVLTKEDFEEKAKDRSTLSYKIKKHGKKIYAKA